MSKTIPLSFLLILLGAGCVQTQPVPEPVVDSADSETTIVESLNLPDGSFALLTDQSSLAWKASKVKVTHNGTVDVASGNVIVADGEVTEGNMEVTMSTLKNLDQEGKFLEMLETHLKSADFFDVTQFPTSTFSVTTVELLNGMVGSNARVDGVLTIKGISQPLSFPAMVVVQDDQIQVSGVATVDRTLYDIKFGSGKFFENLGDGLIDDEFYLDLDLVFEAVSGI